MDKITERQLNEWLGEDNAIGRDIWERKYRHGDETLDEWFERVSGGDAELKDLISQRKFLFGGRILSNRGLHKEGVKVTYSNCYVLPAPQDNIESIYDTASKLARTFSYGGGVGIDISNLAPCGAKVNNTAKETSGAISFIDLYNLTTGLIGQNGRRGALMISISCDHPDVEDFITLKTDLDKATKANLSIRVTDKFLEAVEKDATYTLSFHREETNETITKTIRAKEIFHKFCETNWDYAEPAFLFWDTIENYNLLEKDENFHYAGTNPCAEEPLPAGGSCLLGSLNLSEFVVDRKFDYDSFRNAIHIAVRGLNDVLDEGLPLHPLEIQRNTVRDWRQIGLGIMGLADMLIKLELTYGSSESIDVCDKIGRFLAQEAIKASQYLAEQAEPYPMWNDNVYDSKFFKTHFASKKPLRNSQLLTIAPTGTLSTLLGISGGVEPIFANYYTRKTESLHGEDKYYKIFTKIAWDYLQEHGYGEDESKLPSYFITSPEIPYKQRVDMQSIWQSHIDASISSTVNLPQSTTVEEIEELYLYAWKRKLKGITVFRDGCKRLGILTTNSDKEKDNEQSTEIRTGLPRGATIAVDDDLISAKRTIVSGCGKMYIHLDFDEVTGEPMETWIECGSGGGCERNLTFISRLMSLALRTGVSIESIIDQAMSIKPCKAYCDRTKSKGDTSKGTSCAQAIGYALSDLNQKIKDRCFATEDDSLDLVDLDYKVVSERNTSKKFNSKNKTDKLPCPECGEPLEFEGGCVICHSCGWSKCD